MEDWKLISYYDGQITDILPWHISDSPEVKALGYALNKGTKLLYRYAQRLYLWTNIDSQPENVLDLMAAELRTQYYNQSLDIESKRRLVKNTLVWYMTAGTPEAVEELIAAIFGEGEVKEWFEYDGQPYCFKVITNAILTPDTSDFFTMMIQRVKNTRSHLDAIEIHRTIDQEILAGVGQFSSYKPSTIIGGYNEKRTALQEIFAGTGQFSSYKPSTIIGGYKEQRKTKQEIFAGISQFINYKPAAIIDGYKEQRETRQKIFATIGQISTMYKPATIIDGYKEIRKTLGTSYTGLGQLSHIHQSTIFEDLNYTSKICQRSKAGISVIERSKAPAIFST